MAIVFTKQYYSSKGARTSELRVFSRKAFVSGEVEPCRYTVRLCHIDGESHPISTLNLKDFEKLFTKKEIALMQSQGVLNYYPNEKEIISKYPMFQSLIYRKHGVEK